ncbi:hypothetical protein CDAR_251011 [Caerostris darwini]|uniref:Uncharacterized protein n=1 Tax=Caerostris darwini TaxID=1538125 RepID=A0AAV4TN20_9ARAC|nr:hypothetical protein CDAR_251011 [Caerostris darwini]
MRSSQELHAQVIPAAFLYLNKGHHHHRTAHCNHRLHPPSPESEREELLGVSNPRDRCLATRRHSIGHFSHALPSAAHHLRSPTSPAPRLIKGLQRTCCCLLIIDSRD